MESGGIDQWPRISDKRWHSNVVNIVHYQPWAAMCCHCRSISWSTTATRKIGMVCRQTSATWTAARSLNTATSENLKRVFQYISTYFRWSTLAKPTVGWVNARHSSRVSLNISVRKQFGTGAVVSVVYNFPNAFATFARKAISTSPLWCLRSLGWIEKLGALSRLAMTREESFTVSNVPKLIVGFNPNGSGRTCVPAVVLTKREANNIKKCNKYLNSCSIYCRRPKSR